MRAIVFANVALAPQVRNKMNLFYTEAAPEACAEALDDKRVNNQIRETAQLLCSALRMHGCGDPRLMKATHTGHPVTKWVASSYANWNWTFDHFKALAAEKLVRWPDNPPHKNWRELGPILQHLAMEFMNKGWYTTPVNCASRTDMNLDFRSWPDTIQAYRIYMCHRW